jgi:hypothetical protein
VKRFEEKKRFTLDRVFPGPGKAAVKVGQQVSEVDVIAHCEVSAGQRLIKIAHSLGVSGSDVKRYLTRKIGDRIYEGEVIARKKAILGLGKQEIKSPADGVVADIDERGDLILKFLPKPIRLIAGAKGEVIETKENKIVISSTATKVHGFVSVGRQREGLITVIAKPKEFILPTAINAESQGRILVGGALIEKAALEKAVTIGVKGIVCGGVNFREFQHLRGSLDIGITMIITEGYGNLPIGEDIWNYFSKVEGRTAFISGEENQIVIPETETQGGGEEPSSIFWRELSVGDKVKPLTQEALSHIGVVSELLGDQVLNSGITTEVAKVKFDSKEEIVLPSANLAIIE